MLVTERREHRQPQGLWERASAAGVPNPDRVRRSCLPVAIRVPSG